MAKAKSESTKEKLRTMASRGGTANERAVAGSMLDDLPVLRQDEVAEDEWTGQGVLTRTRNGNKQYLRASALRYFLEHAAGTTVSPRNQPQFTDEYGPGDYYLILSWLTYNGLCEKQTGARYAISSKKNIVTVWNKAVEAMKI